MFTRFLDLCKKTYQLQFLSYDAKIVLKRMYKEQGLYAQGVMVRQKDWDN